MLLSPVSSKTGISSRLLTLTLSTDVPVAIIRDIYVFTKTIHLISVRKKMKLIKLLPLLAMVAGSSFAASPESTVKASGCLAVNDMLENLNSRESCVSVDITRTLSEGRYLAVANLSNGNIYPVRMRMRLISSISSRRRSAGKSSYRKSSIIIKPTHKKRVSSIKRKRLI